MLQSLKKSKRRTVQRLAKSLNHEDESLDDPLFINAVARFHALEKEYSQILQKLKEYEKLQERLGLVSASLGSRFSLPFGGDDVSEFHCAFEEASELARFSTNVLPSCLKVLRVNAIESLENLIRNSFPSRKKMIADHNGLQVDVESYKRRVKALTSKQGNDAKLLKFSAKLENTEHQFNLKHNELLQDLDTMYNERSAYLDPIFAAFLACESEIAQFKSVSTNSIGGQASAVKVPVYRDQITTLVEAGGPPPEKKRSGKLLIFSRWSSKRQETMVVAVPTDDLPYRESVSPPLGPQSCSPATSPNGFNHVDSDFEETEDVDAKVSLASPMDFDSPKIGSPGFSNSPVYSPASDGFSDEESSRVLDDIPTVDKQNVELFSPFSEDVDSDDSSYDDHSVEKCIATFPFEGTDKDDLTFKKGDIITVLDKIDDGWWKGELCGRAGLFPTTYVKAYTS